MKKRFHHVTISVFLQPEETLDFLDPLLPVPTRSFPKEQFSYDPDHERTKIYERAQARLSVQEAEGFDNRITIVTFTFNKITHTNKIFSRIYTNLSAEDKKKFKEDALSSTDKHGRFTIKLEKRAFEKGNNVLTTRGSCIHCSFLLAAYPKNEKTIKENIRKLLP